MNGKNELLKVLHTADWHIGQLFHEYDRTYEHQQFLNWLVTTIRDKEIDVVLISGDVFDLSNPSAASIKMFYSFLSQTVKANSDVQIIIISGNHDSASRLESPKPLLESSNIHIVGIVQRKEDGQIDYDNLVIPLKDKAGTIQAWCMAIPFLRMGDYPSIANCENPYAEGVATFYKEVFQYTKTKIEKGQPVICMGHLHTQQAEITDMDKTERLIMGGVECISASAFHEDIKYVALGHIHKAQRIGGKEHIRYSGSPIPMSFSELNYKHQVIIFSLEGENISDLKAIEIPLSVSLQRVPMVHSQISEVLSAISQLPPISEKPDLAPYLEVRVLLDAPEPALRHKIETALKGKHVRLAKIDVKYPITSSENNSVLITQDKLHELLPLDVFNKLYQSKYNNAVPAKLEELFNQVAQEISQTESV